jgi:hypothetical protein
MAVERDSMKLNGFPAPALGVEERSDEAAYDWHDQQTGGEFVKNES